MIVVAGEALVDLVIRPDGSVSAALGGGPFNVARTIGRLGLDVAFLGCVSTDRFGTRLFDQLRADGVRSDLIVRTEAPTTLAAAELDDGGAATYRFYIDGTAAPGVAELAEIRLPVVAVHVGTLGLVLEPIATTVEAYVGSLTDEVLVMVDPNCRPAVIADRSTYVERIQTLLGRAHIVKISTDDAEYLAPDATPLQLARQMVDSGVRAVLITAGGEQTVVVNVAGERSVSIPPVTVIDTIGAGDSFGGGFLTAWLSAGRSIEDLDDLDLLATAAAAANMVAASTCSRVGADPPWLADLGHDWPQQGQPRQ